MLRKLDSRSAGTPRFGFVLLGGSLNGAQIRDIRLANELHRRGYPVRVWWVVDRPRSSPLNAEIPERWLFHSFRYATGRVSASLDLAGKVSCRLLSDNLRSALAQRIPWLVGGTLRGLIKIVCRGAETDPALIRHFARELTQERITHLMETVEILAPFAEAARPFVPHPLKCVVTFQGYETYAPYAARLGLEEKMYQRIRAAVESSDFPAISVSDQYSERVHREIGVPLASLRTVYPGVPVTAAMDKDRARELVQHQFTNFDPDVPLISYLGRQDSEKGIDLLIYAAQILRDAGFQFQLAICGPTAFGSRYSVACRQIANILKLPVMSSNYVTSDVRSALFRMSHCVVYPSIHAEPFGMVPVEAMVQGTPCIVPDTGGVAQLPFQGPLQGGLTFRSWDSGDLAGQLQLLLTDATLHRRLSTQAPRVAAHYSIERFADRLLEVMELPHSPSAGNPEHRRAA